MQFSGNLLRMMASLIVMIAVLMPLCSDRHAIAADHEAARKMPHNAFRQDAQMGHEQQLVGANGESNQLRPKKMREGTLVPETVGRFVTAGRRWMFIPDHATEEIADLVSTDQQRWRATTNVFRSASVGYGTPDTSSQSHTDESASNSDQRNRLRDSFTTDSFMAGQYQLALKSESLAMEAAPGNPIGLPQIVAVENLMLQRIVEAIRLDGADDRWTISGQLTEFFDENRLQVKTAERATSNER